MPSPQLCRVGPAASAVEGETASNTRDNRCGALSRCQKSRVDCRRVRVSVAGLLDEHVGGVIVMGVQARRAIAGQFALFVAVVCSAVVFLTPSAHAAADVKVNHYGSGAVAAYDTCIPQ